MCIPKLVLTAMCYLLLTTFSTNASEAQLLTQNQVVSVIQNWLGKSNWTPAECVEFNYTCLCGASIHAYGMRNATDIIKVDRSSGNIMRWASEFNGTNFTEDAQIIEAAYNSWAPSHLPAALLSKLTRLSTHGWTYRQVNGICILSTSVKVDVNKQGQVCGAEIEDCHLADFNGTIPINSTQALQIAQNWVSSQYSDSTNQLIWPSDTSIVYYGFVDPNMANTPIIYYLVGCMFQDDEYPHRILVTVNASTGETWDDMDGMMASAMLTKAAKTTMLIVSADHKYTVGYPDSIMPIKSLQSLAKGHKLTAKAGEKAFTMDGKRIALPAKVVAKAGTLYLPWQALKSLPGVKCSYDAKLNKLDITTSPAVKKAK